MSHDDHKGSAVQAQRDTDDHRVSCGTADFEELSSQVLEEGHDLRFRARGSSMHPLVRDDDILKVRPVDGKEISVGDVVFYRSRAKGIVVHRVVSIRRGSEGVVLVVKGDAARCRDPLVHGSQVLGRVVGLERGGREVALDSRLSRSLDPLRLRLHTVRRCVCSLSTTGERGLRRMAAALLGQDV